MQGGKNQVPGERGANRDIRSFAVADFADHYHVRVLAHDVPQAGGEGQTDLRIHVDLIDTIHLVFDGVFDGDDFLVRNVDALERRIERGGLTAAGGSGDQENAVRQRGEMLHAGQHEVVEAQTAQVVEVAGGTVEQAHDYAFAVEGRQRRDAQIDFAAQNLNLDAAVLRQAALGDIELGHQLQARDDGAFELARRRFLVEEHAVHAEAHPELFLERLDVDVAGAVFDGLRDHGIDQPDDGRFRGHVAQMFEILISLGRAHFGVEGLPGALAIVLVDGVDDFLLGGQRGFDFESGERAHGRD